MPPIKRRSALFYVPVVEVRPLMEKLVAEHGSVKAAARHLAAQGYGTSAGSWTRLLQRIRHEEHGWGVNPDIVDALSLETGIRLETGAFRQQVWRVSGLDQSSRGVDGESIRTWYYISKAKALRKRAKLIREGKFLEWATADARWKVLK